MSKSLTSTISGNRLGGPRICIVGAGIAGLSLAAFLSRLKIPFSIYDSRDAQKTGHNYGVNIGKKQYKPIVTSLQKTTTDFRNAVAVDNILGGRGRVSKDVSTRASGFSASDKDVRGWLIRQLAEQGVQVHWDHKLVSLEKVPDGHGANLMFEGKPPVSTDIVIDSSGLRSAAINYGRSVPQPVLLPYATYNGTRRMSSQDFGAKYHHYFHDGNSFSVVPESPGDPWIHVSKVHLRDGKSTPEDHQVEVRWIYSRPPRDGVDPLYRPHRAPEEAKEIPCEFYQEFLDFIRQHPSKNVRSKLSRFFSLSDLQNDRILNWHLRVRLPPQEYFVTNSIRDSYQVIAIGDAARGLPIVKSSGAVAAMTDAHKLSLWLAEVKYTYEQEGSYTNLNFYADGLFWRNCAHRVSNTLKNP